MKALKKFGRFLLQNLVYTVVLVIALVLFLYFAKGDFIAGILTALSALVVYVCIVLLYQEYKKTPNKRPVAKKAGRKK